MDYPEHLSQEQRIDLKEKLLLIAEWYFTKEKDVTTCCGICKALDDAFGGDQEYYDYMASLLVEMHGSSDLALYTNTYEEWESRAYMCLFLVEYLDSTIDLKSSEILRKAQVLLPDGTYEYDEDDYSEYICDCIRAIERDIDSTEGTVNKCRAIRIYISILIEDEFSLEDWIVSKGYATVFEIHDNPQKMQQTRYNMLNDLIAYYESKGD
jgi:hypothetical protein